MFPQYLWYRIYSSELFGSDCSFTASCYGYLGIQKLLGEYVIWLQSNNVREGKLYKESFAKRWPSLISPNAQMHLETYELVKQVDLSLKVIENFSAGAASKLFEQEIREVVSSNFL